MVSNYYHIKPRKYLNLDPTFCPIALSLDYYISQVIASQDYECVTIGIKRNDNIIATYKTYVYNENHINAHYNEFYIERIIKTLLWLKGGFEIMFKGPSTLGSFIKKTFSNQGARKFDVEFMEQIYHQPFNVVLLPDTYDLIENEKPQHINRSLQGNRIGFDAGGSDRKVSAVINGKVVFSEEIIWHPKLHSDPMYHINGIKDSIKKAASYLPTIDTIGVSSAGVYINNQARVASLFMKVPKDLFDKHIKNIYIDIAQEMGNIPIVVANDGDVTALAGSMSLEKNNVLGIAMGTSQAAGYVNQDGNFTGWLNELSFVPVDVSKDAPIEEWSKDLGCGSLYFSQDAVIRLAANAHIEINQSLSPAEKLLYVQKLAEQSDNRALEVFKTIGVYLGYSLAFYYQFYAMEHVLILGRVTSGIGGEIILNEAQKVLHEEFLAIANHVTIQLPDEASRRVGQSIAAASLA